MIGYNRIKRGYEKVNGMFSKTHIQLKNLWKIIVGIMGRRRVIDKWVYSFKKKKKDKWVYYD